MRAFARRKVIYQPQTEEEEKRQDMALTFPWYNLSSGTKVYMKGMLDQEMVDVQEAACFNLA